MRLIHRLDALVRTRTVQRATSYVGAAVLLASKAGALHVVGLSMVVVVGAALIYSAAYDVLGVLA